MDLDLIRPRSSIEILLGAVTVPGLMLLSYTKSLGSGVREV